MNASQRAAQLAQALADPLRLTLLHQLMAGEATVAELTAVTGASQPKVSNHLAVLRAQRLVGSERRGRQMVYRIVDPTVARLVESLIVLAGEPPQLPRPVVPLASARTCYDHLAGSLGVAIFDALVAADAITPPAPTREPVKLGPSGDVTLGAKADEVFGRLGVDVRQATKTRRQFAYACRDWTERRFHLGGALGAALYHRFMEAGWIVDGPERRQLRVTARGREALRAHLGLALNEPDLFDSSPTPGPGATSM